MTQPRVIGVGLGVAFGFVLAWTEMTDPDAIRRMLLLQDAYFFLVMASSMAVAFAGLRIVRAARRRTSAWATSRPARRHVAGSIVFGSGWGISYSCPGPIAAQLGQGLYWSLCTLAGIGVGIVAYLRWQQRASPADISATPAGSAAAVR
jgi:uncharacterized membrane protein YedE/YeeE